MRLHWLAIGITLIVTFSTFGYPLLFDRLYIGLLAVTALVSVNWDKNLLTLCLISITSLLVEEGAWLATSGDRLIVIELAAYGLLLFACYLNRYSRTGKLSIFAAVVTISAECYWFFMGKEGPELYWYVFICASSLIVKHLILIRPHFCSLRIPKYYQEWRITKTDIDMGYILGARIIFEFMVIGEYLVRHVMEYPLQFVYENYHFAAHAILTVTFYIYLRSLAETLRNKMFSA